MIANWSPLGWVWVGLLIAMLVGLVLAFVGCECAKRGFHPLRNASDWFCGLPWPAKLVVVSSIAVGVAIGGSKAPTNNPPPQLSAPRPAPSAESTNVVALTADQLAAQFALVRVCTDEAWRFNPPTNAVMWKKARIQM